MNLNDSVSVLLTAYGQQRFFDHFKALGLNPNDYIAVYFKEPPWITTQLWDLMHIFGDCMDMGAVPVFKNNHIRINTAVRGHTEQA